MNLLHASRRLAVLAVASLFALIVPVRAFAAPPAVDIRGDWQGQAQGGGPYTEHFLTVDCTTGAAASPTG